MAKNATDDSGPKGSRPSLLDELGLREALNELLDEDDAESDEYLAPPAFCEMLRPRLPDLRGGWRYNVTMAANSGVHHPSDDKSTIIELRGPDLWVEAPEDEIPYGVVRVLAFINCEFTNALLCRMSFKENARRWQLQLDLAPLLPEWGGGEVSGFYVQPARDDLLGEFDGQAIRRLLADMPATASEFERRRMQALLDRLEKRST